MSKNFLNFLTTSVIILSCGTLINSSCCYCMEPIQEESDNKANVNNDNLNSITTITDNNNSQNLYNKTVITSNNIINDAINNHYAFSWTDYCDCATKLKNFLWLKHDNLCESDRKKLWYWKDCLYRIGTCSADFIRALRSLSNNIESGEAPAYILSNMQMQLELGQIGINKYKQKIYEANIPYKEAQQILIKLADIKHQLTDGIMSLRLPYAKTVMNLPILLKNFTIIMYNSLKRVLRNTSEMTTKYNNIRPEDFQQFEKEILENFKLLARPLKIMKNYLLGNLYHACNCYQDVCDEILTKQIGQLFKNIDNDCKGWEDYNYIKLPDYLLKKH